MMMDMARPNTKYLTLWLLLLISSLSAVAQTVVRGTVKDASTKLPLQSVSVFFKGGRGVITATDGSYTIKTPDGNLKAVEYSFVGYKTITKNITPGKEQVIDIELQPVYDLTEVTVSTNKRAKYRNKNNPAVELIRKVIENKSKNRASSYDYVQYQEYQKLELSLTKRPEKLLKSKLFKSFSFVLENEDTTKMEGKALLPVYLDERISQKYLRKEPPFEKTYVLGQKRVDYGEFIDNSGVNSYLNRLYQNVDVYDNNINILTTQFLSPIADLSPTFYMFYIRDTVEQDGIKLVKMAFYPRNPNDLLFKGTMFITLDGNYAVQKITFAISKNANVNWTKDLKINQDFERGPDSRYHLINSSMLVEFALTQGSKGSIIGERTVSFKDYTIGKPAPDSVYHGQSEVILADTGRVADSFLVANRHQPLSEVESKVYSNIDSLKNMKSFKRLMDWMTLLLAGYKLIGPNYELGPVSTFYSFNPVEGFRLRAGGRTTPSFSKNIFFENYLAYGFKDQKWKYFLSATWSFNHKSIYSYPLNYLKFSYQYDTKIPGQELQFVSEDNFLLSFKRGNNDKWLYNNIFKAEYVREFGKNFRYTFGFKNWKQTPAGAIIYTKPDGAGGFDNVPNITTSELSAEFRWAPHEKFYQGKIFRIPIINEYPIFSFRYIAGIKGLMNGQYNYHNFNLSIDKRFYLSQLGYTDTKVEGGYIIGKVPFPLLTVHRANQTYSYQLEAYNLMNFMEFVSDRYVAITADHHFNGFFFNKIPLLKKLKWREVISGKVLWGGVRSENDPNSNSQAFLFPKDTVTGAPTTFTLNSGPYIEVSAGVTNIFKLIRVDVVKRLTYLNNPDISKWGIRARLKFDF